MWLIVKFSHFLLSFISIIDLQLLIINHYGQGLAFKCIFYRYLSLIIWGEYIIKNHMIMAEIAKFVPSEVPENWEQRILLII